MTLKKGICEKCNQEGMIYTHATHGGQKYFILSVEVKHGKGKPCRYIWQSVQANEDYGFPYGNKTYRKYVRGAMKCAEDGTFYFGDAAT